MNRHALKIVLVACFVAPRPAFAVFLVGGSLGDYTLSVPSAVDNGFLTPDLLRLQQSSAATGYALSAVEQRVNAQSASLAAWVGKRPNPGGSPNATARGRAEVMVFPDEGQHVGDLTMLYAQLIVRPYAGAVSFATTPSPSSLTAAAEVWQYLDGPKYSFSQAGVIAIPVIVGRPIKVTVSAATPTGGQYAALDMQLVLGFDAKTPAGLIPLPTMPGDANLDGVVDGADYTVWADAYLQSSSLGGWGGDFSRDGIVDGLDYTIWADHFSPATSGLASPELAVAAVPEPSALFLAVIACGVLAAVAVRR